MHPVTPAQPEEVGTSKRTLRLDLAEHGIVLTRTSAGAAAAVTLAARYSGERTIAIGFGELRAVREGALSRLLAQAHRLLEPWSTVGRLELRSLRPNVRRAVLLQAAEAGKLSVVAAGRRSVVLAPAPDSSGRAQQMSANRRRMLLLAARDGERCVWCARHLTYCSHDATVDHVLCRSRGGGDGLENLLLACAACNHRRSDRPAELWLERCRAVGLEVDERAVAAALRRSQQLHRRSLRRVALPAAKAA